MEKLTERMKREFTCEKCQKACKPLRELIRNKVTICDECWYGEENQSHLARLLGSVYKARAYAKERRRTKSDQNETMRARAYANLKRKLLKGEIVVKKCEYDRCDQHIVKPLYLKYDPLRVKWICEKHRYVAKKYYEREMKNAESYEKKS